MMAALGDEVNKENENKTMFKRKIEMN